jgi:GntR family transcriptional regulator
MTFRVNASSGEPVYRQIIHQLRHAIETGVLQPGDVLPGVRSLALELVVSPNTVVKAYEELEQNGWIRNRPGSGAYVSSRHGMRPRADRLRKAQDRVHALIERLRADGVTDEELQRLFQAELVFSREDVSRSMP